MFPSPQNFVFTSCLIIARNAANVAALWVGGPQETNALGATSTHCILMYFVSCWCFLVWCYFRRCSFWFPPAGFCQHLRFININKLEVTLLEICGKYFASLFLSGLHFLLFLPFSYFSNFVIRKIFVPGFFAFFAGSLLLF